MPYSPLNPPPQVRDKDAHEVMRASVFEGVPHFSLRRGFADPAAWGILFVDAARHVARVYAHEKLFTEDQAMELIRTSFEEAIRQPPDPESVTAIEKS